MLAQLEPYLPILEGYLTAENKATYFDSITDPVSKEVLDLLTSPLYNIADIKERMTKLNLDSNFQQILIDEKIKELIQNADKIKSEKLFKEIKERLIPNENFEYSRPYVQKEG